MEELRLLVAPQVFHVLPMRHGLYFWFPQMSHELLPNHSGHERLSAKPTSREHIISTFLHLSFAFCLTYSLIKQFQQAKMLSTNFSMDNLTRKLDYRTLAYGVAIVLFILFRFLRSAATQRKVRALGIAAPKPPHSLPFGNKCRPPVELTQFGADTAQVLIF